MNWTRHALTFVVAIVGCAVATAQPLMPDSFLLPVAGQTPAGGNGPSGQLVPPSVLPPASGTANPTQLPSLVPPTPGNAGTAQPPAVFAPQTSMQPGSMMQSPPPGQPAWMPPPPPPAAQPADPLFPQPTTVSTPPLVQDIYWANAGLLLGWSQRSTPPTAWTVPASGSTIYLANQHHNSPYGAGMTFDTGVWLAPERGWGIDAGFLFLDTYQRFRDPTNVSSMVSNYYAGTGETFANYWTADVNLRHRLYKSDMLSVDAMIGYRYAKLKDTGWIDSVISTPDGGIVIFTDKARATTTFNGGQIGFATSYRYGRWTFDTVGKVALGETRTSVNFTGDSANAIAVGAAPGNLPSSTSSQFSVLPSASATLGLDMGLRSRFTVGYNFQYMTNVVRSTDVFRAATDPTGAAPSSNSSFWVQGVTLGWQWRY